MKSKLSDISRSLLTKGGLGTKLKHHLEGNQHKIPIGRGQVWVACAVACAIVFSPRGSWPEEAAVSADEPPDIALFAQVMVSDPARSEGTKAGRTEEMPAEDVFLESRLRPSAAGCYDVPKAPDGRRAVGLRWYEARQLSRLEIHWAAAASVPAAAGVQLQYWSGESPWQGQWKPLAAELEQFPGLWRWRIKKQELSAGTMRVRWLFPAATEPLLIKRFSAYSRSSWQWAELRAMLDSPLEQLVRIEVYNGLLQDNKSSGNVTNLNWDTQYEAVFKVRYSDPRPLKSDRTVLRFILPDRTPAVAVEDVIAHDCVFVPEAGLFVSINPPRVTREQYKQRIARQRRVLEEVRAEADQSFAQALSKTHNPVQNRGPMLLSLACDNRKFTVNRDGSISFFPYDAADARYHSPDFQADSFRLASCFGEGWRIERRLDGGWLPKPITTAVRGGLRCRQSTYVAPLDRQPPKGWPEYYRRRAACVAEYVLENLSADVAQVSLPFVLVKKGNQGLAEGELQQVDQSWLAVVEGRLLAVFDTRQSDPLKLVRRGGSLRWEGHLGGGQSARLAVVLPAWPLKPEAFSDLEDIAVLSARTDEYWRKQLSEAMQIELPDRQLADVIRASQVHCLLAARNEHQGRYIAPWVAATNYGPLESEAQAVIRGMDMCGQSDFARRGLEFFLQRYNSQGFLTGSYTLVGTGEHLWTLAEHFQRTGDREWLQRVSPILVRACRWIARQRAKTKRLDPWGEKVPEYGLMPPGVSADWNRFAYRFFNDAQYCHGLLAAAAVLAEIGHPEAPTLLAEAEQYRKDLLRAFRWTQARCPVVPLADGTWTANHPSMLACFGNVEEFFPGEDADRSWCYSVELGGHHLAANRLLDPRSDEVGRMMDYLEDYHFLRSGHGDYPEQRNRADVFNLGGFAKLQPYYARAAEIYALRDDVKPFLRSYFNALASLLNEENLSLREHFNNNGAWNKTHETGWFLCQTSMMFASERDGALWLAPLVTDRWLQGGMKVEVRNVPTRFGPVSYKIISAADRGCIEAEIFPNTRRKPRRLVLRLRHPEGKPIRTVTLDGRPHGDFDPRGGLIFLPPTDKRISVRAEY